MNVYKKLQAARVELQSKEIKKSGNNKFAGYKYFELGDYLPTIQVIFNNTGLCGVVRFSDTAATLTIYDVDDPTQSIEFQSPMSTAALKGCHEVQNLGAVQTYIRRYLWQTALEIVEHDALDASQPITEKSNIDELLKKIAKISSKVEQEECRKAIAALNSQERTLANIAYIDRIEHLKANLMQNKVDKV
jgi:hypothetical protein